MKYKETEGYSSTFYQDESKAGFDEGEGAESLVSLFREESVDLETGIETADARAGSDHVWETDFWGEQRPHDQKDERRTGSEPAVEKRVRRTRKAQKKTSRTRKPVFIGIAVSFVIVFAGTAFALSSPREDEVPKLAPILDGSLDDFIIVETPGVTAIENVEDFEFIEGQTYQFDPKVMPEMYQDLEVTYTSENQSIVTVDENGVATAVSAGTTKITVSVGGFSKTITVTVYEDSSSNWGTRGNSRGGNSGGTSGNTEQEQPQTPSEPEIPSGGGEEPPSSGGDMPEPSTPEGGAESQGY